MKIVIDIPEEVFDEIYNNNYYSLKGKAALRVAVRNGTPLPKGHGDLIDRKDLIKDFRDSKKGFWRKKHFIKGEATMESMAYEINDIKNILNNASTVIEADEGDRDEIDNLYTRRV